MASEPETAKDSDNAPDHRALVGSITENFPGVYLTMLSIIQGVAFTDLANIAFSERAHFTVVNWIEVATMLWSLMYIWNHFMADALMTHWIPGLEDAVLLFGTGVFELVANHAIVWGATAWLATLALMLCGWAGGTFYIRRQEERVVRDPALMAVLRRRTAPTLLETLGGGVLLGALSVVCGVTTGSPTLALAAVAVAFAVSLVIGIVSSAFWRRVRRYAYSGEAP